MSLLSHVDVRVRNRERAYAFYDALFALFDAVREEGKTFSTYQFPSTTGDGDEAHDWFGITEDANARPDENRIAFAAPNRELVDRVSALLPSLGAREVEGSDGIYGANYYAVFFTDPDGNRLEVCHLG